MEADSWSRPAGTSRRHLQALQSRFETLLGFEDAEMVEDDFRTEFPCPYCTEDLDIAGLCHHISIEHPVEAKTGVCPFCEARFGADILEHVCHLTMMHGNHLKTNRRKRSHRGSSISLSTLSLLKRELREGQLQSLFESSLLTSASSTAPDPLLSNFILSSSGSDLIKEDRPPQISASESVECEKVPKKSVDREERSLTEKEHEEKAKRASFVQGLVLSTLFGDNS